MDNKFKKALPYIEVLAGFLGVLLLLFFLFDNWILPSMVKDKKIVEVPNLVGQKLDKSIELLNSLGLEYKVVSQQFNETYSKDYIIKQNPSPGTDVKESREILLTVSKGIESVVVPYLLFKNETTARNEIINLDLSVGNISYELNDSIPKGQVFGQSPSPGTKVGYNSKVDLMISSGGNQSLLVPDLIGKTYNEAQYILNEIGLRLGEVTYQRNETFLPNTIIKQVPAKNDTVYSGAMINVLITK